MIPKFRVWDKDDEEMREVLDIDFMDEGFLVKSGNYRRWKDIEDVILMQSTGLKDKNGVEIYEGDIVNSMNKKFRIIFKDAEFTADGINIRLKKIVSHMEVVGNIWEDGELLEGAAR